MHMHTTMCVMQVYNVCVHVEDHMGTHCTYNGPILWGCNARTKDESYGVTMLVQKINVWEHNVQRTNPVGQCM